MLNVSTKAKVVKTVYNVMLDRMESVTLGSVRANIADTIVSQNKEIASKPTKTALEQAREAATAWLTNGNGYAYFRKDDMGNIIDILFLDTPDIETAVNVLRVGQSGIGFSHNGVNGPYESAWTIDGRFNADFITTGTLSANLIKSGTMQSENGTVSLNLDEGGVSFIRPNETYVSIGQLGITYGKFENGEEKNKSAILLFPSLIQISTSDGVSAALVGVGGTTVGYSHSETIIKGENVSVSVSGTQKTLSWKDNGDGTYTLIGK
jgi:hypothetical protein